MSCAIGYPREVVLLAMDAISMGSGGPIGAQRVLAWNDSGEVPAPKEGSLHEVSSVRR